MSSKTSTKNLDQTILSYDHITDSKKTISNGVQYKISEFEDTLEHYDELSELKVRNRSAEDNSPISLDARYTLEELLGVGGFASVHKAHDQKVGRKLALKSLESSDNEIMIMSFNLEARVMSQLDHPGILPVYDLIENLDSKDSELDTVNSKKLVTAYSMRIASHASLYENLVKSASLDIHNLCQNLHRVALTLEHAHQRGVLHRDIKPQNILLGNAGEVYLTDWGVCLLMPHHQDYHLMNEEYTKALVGTPSYMPPEQAAKLTVDARTDVFGLGTCLYFALTGQAPIVGENLKDAIQNAQQAMIMAPSQVWLSRGLKFPYPQALENICLKCLNKDPSQRYQSARALAKALESFNNGELERARLKQTADKAFHHGKPAFNKFLELFDAQKELLIRVDKASVQYKKSRSENDREYKWSLEEELDALLNPLEESFTQAISAFQSALRAYPQHDQAKDSITQLYKVRYERALNANDQAMSIFFESQIREFANAEELKLLDQASQVYLQGLPQGVKVEVYSSVLKRYETILTKQQTFDNYQGEAIFLARGRYLIELTHPKASLVRINLWIKSYQKLQIETPLPIRSAIPKGFVYIKDKLAFSEFPTTMQEYCNFLNELSVEEADQRIPRYHQTPYCFRSDSGRFELPYTDLEGDQWQSDWPVILITYHDAVAYTKWLSKHLNVTARLPSKTEWLEAASGGDCRNFPWGNSFDASLCVMRESHTGRPAPTSINDIRKDRSPYGVYHVAGNICQWTLSTIPGVPKHKYMMGASYNSQEIMCHLDHTMQAHEDETFVHLGIRVVLELDDDDFLPSDLK